MDMNALGTPIRALALGFCLLCLATIPVRSGYAQPPPPSGAENGEPSDSPPVTAPAFQTGPLDSSMQDAARSGEPESQRPQRPQQSQPSSNETRGESALENGSNSFELAMALAVEDRDRLAEEEAQEAREALAQTEARTAVVAAAAAAAVAEVVHDFELEQQQLQTRAREAALEAAENALAASLASNRDASPDPIFIPIPAAEGDSLAEEFSELVRSFGPSESGAVLPLLIGFLMAWLLSIFVGRTREQFLPRGILPAVLAFLHLVARIVAVGCLLGLIARFLPERFSIVVLLVFVGLALAIGWSARDLLPDLIAGVVLAFERRVRVGMWIASAKFAGQVETVGFRSCILRDPQGCQITVPNRHLLAAPLSTDSHREREQEVILRLEQDFSLLSAEEKRTAITDAVLASPWVAPGHRPLVLRDPDDPTLWKVRARVLNARFGVRFEGELLERAEENLYASRSARTDSNTDCPPGTVP